jgi:hypothetical protein
VGIWGAMGETHTPVGGMIMGHWMPAIRQISVTVSKVKIAERILGSVAAFSSDGSRRRVRRTARRVPGTKIRPA